MVIFHFEVSYERSIINVHLREFNFYKIFHILDRY